MIIAYIDGSCIPPQNGGKMGAGVWISRDGSVSSHSFSWPPKKDNTNNKAEYLALMKLIELLAGVKGEHIQINSDSQLLIFQMKGRYKINRGAYKELALECKALLKELKQQNNVQLVWIPRSQNKKADYLSRL